MAADIDLLADIETVCLPAPGAARQAVGGNVHRAGSRDRACFGDMQRAFGVAVERIGSQRDAGPLPDVGVRRAQYQGAEIAPGQGRVRRRRKGRVDDGKDRPGVGLALKLDDLADLVPVFGPVAPIEAGHDDRATAATGNVHLASAFEVHVAAAVDERQAAMRTLHIEALDRIVLCGEQCAF
ncbi:hypothetical protein D9M68_361930 [compost metagenome]